MQTIGTESKSMFTWDREQEGRITKGHEEIIGDGGYIHHFHCGDGLMGVYICQNLFSFTF